MNELNEVEIKYKDFEENEKSFKVEERISIIYGDNGSGKTTFINSIESQNNDNIKIFNESFIEKNLKITDDGSLKAIVLFGDGIENQKEIDDKIKEKENLKNNMNDIEKEMENNKKELEKIEKEIKKKLKESWSIREEKIKNSKSNLTPNIFNKIISSSSAQIEEINLEEKIKEFSKIRNESNEFYEPIEIIDVKNQINDIEQILKTKLEKKETKLADKIYDFITKDIYQLEKSKSFFLMIK